jgi:hypothetical protein
MEKLYGNVAVVIGFVNNMVQHLNFAIITIAIINISGTSPGG